MTRAATFGTSGLGDDEGLAEAVVEPLGELPGELEVLALVVAHGHQVGVVQQDVRGHQDRVGEQPAADRPRCAAAFSLNWVIRRSSP